MSVDTDQRVAALRRRSRRAELGPEIDDDRPSSTPPPPRIPGRRNPKWIAMGVVAICLGGLLSYLIYARVANEDTVVAMAATVYRGQVVEQADLTTVTLSGEAGVSTVPSDQLPSLVGKRAAFDLVAGSIVNPDSVNVEAVPAPNRSVVGLRLLAGRAPAGFLDPGSTVRLVVVPPANAEPGFSDGYKDKSYPATIVDSQAGADAGSLMVDVDVASAQAAVVALLAASDRIAIVRDADR